MPPKAELLVALERCHLAVTGDAVDLAAIPPECPFVDLDQHGISLDSIGLLELVVTLEDELGCQLDLAERDVDWTTYRWGEFLADLDAAVGSAGP